MGGMIDYADDEFRAGTAPMASRPEGLGLLYQDDDVSRESSAFKVLSESCFYFTPFSLDSQHCARFNRNTINMDNTSAALASIATDMSTR